jgi:hypothetical protein
MVGTVKSSRALQNLQHVVGGLNSLLLLVSGIYIGKDEWWHAGVLVFSYFVLNRLSSELFYRILVRVNGERC